MNYFIKNIHINKLFHLENIDIPIAHKKYPHLIITGKNGSGKTVLLNAIADFLNLVLDEKSTLRTNYIELSTYQNKLKKSTTLKEATRNKKQIRMLTNRINKQYGSIGVSMVDAISLFKKNDHDDFVVVFYQADRKIEMEEPKNPTKPIYNKKGNVKEIVTDQFLNFMSDLKIQEALARNEKQYDDANEINAWFVDFEGLLKQIFQDDKLTLEFNYKDYSFLICKDSMKFKLTQLSDGFAAVLDIVADLILKMQDDESLLRSYQKEGIVLIDEIETHLHLGLQKIIMPFLTKIFPNIQFIVTTHSPFILSSMYDAVAYDLEHKEILSDLTDYSYEALAEGYFGVKTPSSYAEMQLANFKELLNKEPLTDSDKVKIKKLKSDFESIPETVSPLIVGEFLEVVRQNDEKLKNLLR